MAIDYKKTLDNIHISIHAARMIPNAQMSELMKKIEQNVIEAYPDCAECKERLLALKYQTAQPQASNSFLKGLFK